MPIGNSAPSITSAQPSVVWRSPHGFAALPTIRKAWTHPETETGAPFIAALFGGFAALVSVQDWVILEYAFPVYLFGINWVLLYSIYRRRIFKCHSS